MVLMALGPYLDQPRAIHSHHQQTTCYPGQTHVADQVAARTLTCLKLERLEWTVHGCQHDPAPTPSYVAFNRLAKRAANGKDHLQPTYF